MKILINGGKGMLGRTLQQEFRDCELIIADLPEADITDPSGKSPFLSFKVYRAALHPHGFHEEESVLIRSFQ